MADKKPGVNWNALIKLVAPVVGDLASGGDRGAFLSGYMQEQERREQLRAERTAAEQRRKATGADYLLKIGEHAQGIEDPLDFENFLNLAEQAGTSAGYVDPGALRSGVTFNRAKHDAKQADVLLTELTKELAALEGGPNPFNLDELSASGATIQLKNGQSVPVSTAIDMTRRRPATASGQPMARPKPVVNPPDRSFVEQQFDDLLALWQEQNPGKQPPATVRTQMRQQAQRQIGRADDRPPAPTRDGPTDAQAFSMEERLAKAWTSANQSAREMQRQYSLMQTGLKRFRQGDKNGGSQAVLVTFQKILDPTSVVRESEYARTAAGQSLLNRIEGYTDRLARGGAGMTEGELAQMVETARQFVDEMKAHTAGQRRRIENQVKTRKLDPASVFDDVLTGETDPAKSAQDELRNR